MAISVLQDYLLDNSTMSVSAGKMTIVRRLILQGVVPTNASQWYERILLANIDAVTPQIGSAYPQNGATPVVPNLVLVLASKEIKPLPNSNEKYEVICTYEPSDPSILPPFVQATGSGDSNFHYARETTSASLTSVQSNILYGVETAANTFTAPADVTIELYRSGAADPKDNRPTQTALVEKQTTVYVKTFTRHEIAEPQSVGFHDYVGTINESGWGRFDALQVLFTGLNYEPVAMQADGKWSYLATYTFQCKWEGDWTTSVIYTDPENNLPLAGATDDYSNNRTKRRYLGYRLYDFNDFELFV